MTPSSLNVPSSPSSFSDPSALNQRIHGSCVYCDTFLSTNYSPLHVWDFPIRIGSDYVVVAAKGPLLPGWLLVVSKRHTLCSGRLSSEEMRNIQFGIESAKSLIRKPFGAATVFESGPAIEGTAVGCGIDHAHFHIVPLSFSLSAMVSKAYPEIHWRPCVRFERLRSAYLARKHYLYIHEPNCPPLVATVEARISQLFRRVIASATGQSESWDYSQHSFSSTAQKTVSTLTANCHNFAESATLGMF